MYQAVAATGFCNETPLITRHSSSTRLIIATPELEEGRDLGLAESAEAEEAGQAPVLGQALAVWGSRGGTGFGHTSGAPADACNSSRLLFTPRLPVQL